jgi:hypothetical protein
MDDRANGDDLFAYQIVDRVGEMVQQNAPKLAIDFGPGLRRLFEQRENSIEFV